jgi:hypothetical protein
MPACTVCDHRRLADVNAEVQQGDTNAAIAKRHGLSVQALGRHVRGGHVPDDAVSVSVADPETESVLAEVRALLVHLRPVIERAARTANDRSLVAATAETRRTLELIGRLIGELTNASTVQVQVNLATTPEFTAAMTTIRDALVAECGVETMLRVVARARVLAQEPISALQAPRTPGNPSS